MTTGTPFTLGSHFAGYTLTDLQDWVRARADNNGHVDLVAYGLPRQLREAWLPTADDLKTLKVKVDYWPGSPSFAKLDLDTGEVKLAYKAQIVTELGDYGRLRRTLDTSTGTVEHCQLMLPPDAQGHGLGRRSVRRSADLYLNLGISQVKVTAVDVGLYVWPMSGFESDDQAVFSSLVKSVGTFAEALGHPEVAAFKPQHLWELQRFNLGPDDEFVMVTREQIENAIAAQGRNPAVVEVPIKDSASLIAASFIWGGAEAWAGTLTLEANNLGVRRLDTYTKKRDGTPI